MQGCGFRDLEAEFKAKNAVIFGVSFDTAEENLAFSEKFSFNFPLLCDTDRTMGEAYGAAVEGKRNARRIGIVIDPAGIVVDYDPTVDAGSYPADVLAKI